MNHDRAHRFFDGIVDKEKIDNPSTVTTYTDDILNEVLWDAFNGRGKRAATKVKPSKKADKYITYPEDKYLDIEKAINEVVEELNKV